jgi:Dockerin type I domain/PEP-CTERM motif
MPIRLKTGNFLDPFVKPDYDGWVLGNRPLGWGGEAGLSMFRRRSAAFHGCGDGLGQNQRPPILTGDCNTTMATYQTNRWLPYVLAAIVALVGTSSLWAQIQPADASFAAASEVNLLNPPLTDFGTFRQNNPGTTLNFNVYNRPAPSGTTSPMSLVNTQSIGDSAAIALQTGTVSGLQPVVGMTGNPHAAMQLNVSTSQVGNLQVSYTMEFASDSLPAAPHESLAIAAYVTVLRHGDYNADGKVDAGDYVVWRKTQNSSVPAYTRADDTGDGLVNQADYTAWRNVFTGTFGSGSEALFESSLSGPLGVPEPTTAALGLLGAASLSLIARRRSKRSGC